MTEIKKLYAKIIDLRDLTPSEATNALFSRLVTVALSQKSFDLTAREMSKLQQTCSVAEYELEKFWSTKIQAAKNPKAALQNFPYYDNYAKLTQLEWLSLLGCTSHRAHKVIFIGGGPLPMTAILLAQMYGQQVTILEKDPEAALLSRKLCSALGLQKKVSVVAASGEGFAGYRKFNAFFVAALAGLDPRTKLAIILRVQKQAQSHSHILVRSSWGSREILYKPFDAKAHRGKTIVEVRPHNDVVNSFYIMHT